MKSKKKPTNSKKAVNAYLGPSAALANLKKATMGRQGRKRG